MPTATPYGGRVDQAGYVGSDFSTSPWHGTHHDDPVRNIPTKKIFDVNFNKAAPFFKQLWDMKQMVPPSKCKTVEPKTMKGVIGKYVATTTATCNHDATSVTVTAGHSYYFRKGSLAYLPDVDEYVRITHIVHSTNTIHFERDVISVDQAGSASTTHTNSGNTQLASGAQIWALGSTHTEGSSRPWPRSTITTFDQWYCELMMWSKAFSETRANTPTESGRDWAYENALMKYEAAYEIELKMLFGPAYPQKTTGNDVDNAEGTIGTSGETIYYTCGLLQYIRNNSNCSNYDLAQTAITRNKFFDWMIQLSGNARSNDTIHCYMGGDMLREIYYWIANDGMFRIEQLDGQKDYGLSFEAIKLGGKRFVLHRHYLFDTESRAKWSDTASGTDEGTILAIDPKFVYWFVHQDFRLRQKCEDNGSHRRQSVLDYCGGLGVVNPECHGVMYGGRAS